MTTGAWALLAVAAVIAVGDWVAKARGNEPLEYACKPLTMVALVGVALVLDPADAGQRGWVVAALVLSLLGDVLLMVPERDLGPADTFTFGLASFLLGHVAYIGGFAHRGLGSPLAVAAAVVAVAIAVVVAPRIVGGARAHDPALGVAVTAYIAVIITMLLASASSGVAIAAVGAALFVASDAMIGWSRFVSRFPGHELGIIVTYHVAQALLVTSMAAG